MVFDPTYAEIDMSSFKECDWKEFYGEVSEPLPPNMPEPRGKEIEIRLYVDSDHAGDQLVRRSRTGYFVFLNIAPLIWFSKRQPTVEISVFGAEFVALKNGMETVRGLIAVVNEIFSAHSAYSAHLHMPTTRFHNSF